jgi:hypothetical protein
VCQLAIDLIRLRTVDFFLCFLILEIVDNKAANISRISKFLNIRDYDLSEVIQETTLGRTKELRKAKFDGLSFWETICYGPGTKDAWRKELSPEVLEIYYKSIK